MSNDDDGIQAGIFVPASEAERIDDPEIRERIKQVTGMQKKPDPDCSTVLPGGLDPEECGDMESVRRWVMCTAWQNHRDGRPFDRAVQSAWDSVDRECPTM